MQTGARRPAARPVGGIPPHPEEAHAMNINASHRQPIGGLAVAALLAGLVAVGLSNPLPADDPPAPKADDFSPYVTKDGGISLPLDYREKFLHLGSWAVATKPGKPVDRLDNVYRRPEE